MGRGIASHVLKFTAGSFGGSRLAESMLFKCLNGARCSVCMRVYERIALHICGVQK